MTQTTQNTTLPVPSFFDEKKVGEVWHIPYTERGRQAQDWAKRYGITTAATDRTRIGLMIIDAQNTFCVPGYELFVGGRSGTGAVDDNVRLARFIYRELARITNIIVTMDTHVPFQIFHTLFWVNDQGEHPADFTMITVKDVESGVWKVNPALAVPYAKGNYRYLQDYSRHYVRSLEDGGKYLLTEWPIHAQLLGIDHALVSAIGEAVHFHQIARTSPVDVQIKGGNPFTENYSVLRPEVLDDQFGNPIAQRNTKFIEALLAFDVLIIAGQAKSHCVAWTIADLLNEIAAKDRSLAEKVYLLEDCTSPVVVPGLDYTQAADEAFERFAQAGMHVVRSTDPLETWPGLKL